MATTSKAMRELLERKGIVPTGEAAEDMKLAKSVMPTPYNELKGVALNPGVKHNE